MVLQDMKIIGEIQAAKALHSDPNRVKAVTKLSGNVSTTMNPNVSGGNARNNESSNRLISNSLISDNHYREADATENEDNLFVNKSANAGLRKRNVKTGAQDLTKRLLDDN